MQLTHFEFILCQSKYFSLKSHKLANRSIILSPHPFLPAHVVNFVGVLATVTCVVQKDIIERL
jgi:hypothetical protein